MNKKLSLIYILEILKEYTDDCHPLTQKDIAKKLYNIYGLECERKSISSNIDYLIEAGFDIVKSNNGCYLRERELEQSEISFLVDAVFSSRAIDSNKAQLLTKKLTSFLSKYNKKNYNYIYKSGEITRTANKQLFYTIDVLHEAIEKKKQVEFFYDRPYISKEIKEKQKTKKYKVNPYFLVNNQGRYYLVCNYDYFDNIANYKLELIKDIKIIDAEVKPITHVKGCENGLDIAKYANENIYMFSASAINVELKLENEYAVGSLIDWFGKNVKFSDRGGDIYADINVNEQAIIYWCLQYGESVELISPIQTRNKIKKLLVKLNNKYN